MEDVKNWLDSTFSSNDQLRQLKDQVNSKTNEAIEKAKSGFVIMEAATTEQVQEAKTFANKVSEEYFKYEDITLRHVKRGVQYGIDNPAYAAATAATVLLFTNRGSRRFLYRNTLGRFRSEEADILNSERQVKDVRTNLDIYKLDMEKLQERADVAESEFVSGRRKLKATGSELHRLWKNYNKVEEYAKSLKETARDLPARESIRLRAEAASLASEAKQNKNSLGKRIYGIAKLGINV